VCLRRRRFRDSLHEPLELESETSLTEFTRGPPAPPT
jgi:hypothetical protein